MPSAVEVVLGTGGFGYKPQYVNDKAVVLDILNLFKKYGGKELDTARIYGEGTSETILSDVNYEELGFILDTKAFFMPPGAFSAAKIHEQVEASLHELKKNKVHIFYLHGPDRSVPLEETLGAINEEYKKGHFEKFGLSNFTPEEVEQAVEIAKKHGWVQPTVYQGLYNLLARANEETLFPVLRKHGISFFAYSPLAGSFLTDADPNTHKRFDANSQVGKLYRDKFFKDSHFKALDLLRAAAAKHGISVSEIALRWINHHSLLKRSFGDAIITGGSKIHNLEASFVSFEKPALPEDLLKVAEECWQTVKGDPASYHF